MHLLPPLVRAPEMRASVHVRAVTCSSQGEFHGWGRSLPTYRKPFDLIFECAKLRIGRGERI